MGNIIFTRTRDNQTYTVSKIQELGVDFNMEVEPISIPDENEPQVVVVGGCIIPMTIQYIRKELTISDLKTEVQTLRDFFATGYFGEEYKIEIEDWGWTEAEGKELYGSIQTLSIRQSAGVPYMLRITIRFHIGTVI
ncbi:hypothetical protein JDFR1000234_60 [uncultured archaeal virus]|jgi:hypothetical protein|uniref:Uncharacterized protein n=1 Tax=uncultured archaeal virus TaxID=1960247 RepID=A0A1S5Y342_9VIRU|nr:hypothetical protein JDFR1000234_60 [uncultured archaeal virus]